MRSNSKIFLCCAAAFALSVAGPFVHSVGALQVTVDIEPLDELGVNPGFVSPSLSRSGDGYVVTWTTINGPFGPTPTPAFARFFSASGVALTDAIQLSADAVRPLARDLQPGGPTLIAWTEDDPPEVRGQLFSASGTAMGAAFSIASVPDPDSGLRAVTGAPGTEFVVYWGGDLHGTVYDYSAQRFSAAGTPVGSEFQPEAVPAAGPASDGSYVAVATARLCTDSFCQGDAPPLPDGTVSFRRYDSSGTPAGPITTIVNDPDVHGVHAAMTDNGDIGIAWTLGAEWFAHRYDASDSLASQVSGVDATTQELALSSSNEMLVRTSGLNCDSGHGGGFSQRAERWSADGLTQIEDVSLIDCRDSVPIVQNDGGSGVSNNAKALLLNDDGSIVNLLNDNDPAGVALPKLSLVIPPERQRACSYGNGTIECEEECDDGNDVPCDGCDLGIAEDGHVCGDGTVLGTCGEQCDDSNDVAGDGCGSCALEELVDETVTPGQTVGTDDGSGPTEADPVEMAITSPNGGQVSVLETGATDADPAGFQLLNHKFDITAPDGSAADPLVLSFSLLASSLPAGIDETNLEVRKNGAAVEDCLGHDVGNVPLTVDPCVSAREAADGNVTLTVASTTASEWDFLAPLCTHLPAQCRKPHGAQFQFQEKGDKDKLKFAWKNGIEPTLRAAFGDPGETAAYALCVYDADGLVQQLSLGPSDNWDTSNDKKVKYSDKTQAQDGVKKVQLAGGSKPKLQLQAAGPNLPLIDPAALTPPIQVQLVNSETPICWDAVFPADQTDQRKATKVKAKCSTKKGGCE